MLDKLYLPLYATQRHGITFPIERMQQNSNWDTFNSLSQQHSTGERHYGTRTHVVGGVYIIVLHEQSQHF
eukprot:m.202529 g.202529  ORF g.202529 m.202529 type:complete len:70 (+) comp18834_c1_seq2:109-318(+)